MDKKFNHRVKLRVTELFKSDYQVNMYFEVWRHPQTLSTAVTREVPPRKTPPAIGLLNAIAATSSSQRSAKHVGDVIFMRKSKQHEPHPKHMPARKRIPKAIYSR